MLWVLLSVVQGVTKQTIGFEQRMRYASLLFAAGLKHCTLYSGLHRTHALYSNMLVFIGVHVCFDTSRWFVYRKATLLKLMLTFNPPLHQYSTAQHWLHHW